MGTEKSSYHHRSTDNSHQISLSPSTQLHRHGLLCFPCCLSPYSCLISPEKEKKRREAAHAIDHYSVLSPSSCKESYHSFLPPPTTQPPIYTSPSIRPNSHLAKKSPKAAKVRKLPEWHDRPDLVRFVLSLVGRLRLPKTIHPLFRVVFKFTLSLQSLFAIDSIQSFISDWRLRPWTRLLAWATWSFYLPDGYVMIMDCFEAILNSPNFAQELQNYQR